MVKGKLGFGYPPKVGLPPLVFSMKELK